MMDLTRQQWRIFAIATIVLIVVILITTQVSIQFQVNNKAIAMCLTLFVTTYPS